MKRILEDKKMAIINLTCDYPFEYSVSQLSRWVNLSGKLVSRVCKELNLDVVNGISGAAARPISGKRKYLKNVF